ncbi:hypothetical protein [Mycobacterium sp. SP-6446]|uniref:hypothetical protein n=1 Tax=Mycobacterium sp. SP-6446 TaxID=1834162 RepID=UPI00096D25E1|nr:hypothetical protein [Mycobacterium sp. SP-6446]OMC17186.1 hypothetical protein A5736_16810 [Mycobacterium sp. SP-6446]
MTELPAQIKGLVDGFAIELRRAEDSKDVLIVRATDDDGEYIDVALGQAMANALWSAVREWTYRSVGQEPPTDKP